MSEEDDRGVVDVAQHDQRDEDEASHHSSWEQQAVLRRLKHDQSGIVQEKRFRFETTSTATHPLDERRGAAADHVHGVKHDEAANTGEHFVWDKQEVSFSCEALKPTAAP